MIRAIGAYSLSECMEILAERVAEGERRDADKKNVVFCEDRLTLVCERALTQKIGGSFRSYVTTYARALKTRARVLSKQGSVMAIDGIVTRLRKEGKLRRFAQGVPRGTAKSLYETISQLAASAVDADTLSAGAETLENGVLRDKIRDVAEIYGEYKRFLAEEAYVDESGYLALLPEYLKSNGEIDGADVYFVCYGSFTAQSFKTLRAAFERAENVTGIFCCGKEDFYTHAAMKKFEKCAREYAAERGAAQPIVENLGVPLGGEAEILRKGLFDPTALKAKTGVKTGAIRLFEAEDKTDEAEKVAAKIRRALAEDTALRYRDFAVLTSDTKGYALAVKRAFSEYGIPYFLDEKRSLKTHPLSAFLLSCFTAVRTGYSPDAIDALLQNPFFGGADEYRNYLLKYANYRGGAKNEIKPIAMRKEGEEDDLGACEYDEKLLNENREKLLRLLRCVKTSAAGEEYCACVRELLRISGAKERLTGLIERTKDVALKNYLSQIDGAIERLLCECEALIARRAMTVAEFETLFSDGLDATEISLIPVKTDAVFVGDIHDSRIEKVKMLFAVGMNDGVPKNTTDTALISDREIEKLKEIKAKIEPTVAEVNLRSREDAALNLCTFTKRAYFSYALSPDGSEPMLSEVFKYIRALFRNEDGEPIQTEKGWTEGDFVYACAADAPAMRRWYLERDEDERRGVFYGERCNAIEQALARKHEDNVWSGAAYAADCAKDGVSCGEELFFRRGKISPSALETYFSCPFKHFLRYGLQLKEREEQSVMATDSGNFIHELLQRIACSFEKIKTEDEAAARAAEIAEQLLKKPPYCYSSDTGAGAYAQKRLTEEGIAAAKAAFRQIKGSLYTVGETEKSVETQNFRGKVDRVDVSDEFVRIIDYKTGAIDDTPSSYYTGQKLQLQLYMTAVRGDKIPAGVFYFPASVSFSDEESVPFRMKGFFCGDDDAVGIGDVTMSDAQDGVSSEFFPKKKGEKSNAHALDRMTFSAFVDYSTYVAEGACREIADGFIGVSPHKGACSYCPYGGACGFNPDKTACREDDFTVSAKRIASIVNAEREEKEKEREEKTDRTHLFEGVKDDG